MQSVVDVQLGARVPGSGVVGDRVQTLKTVPLFLQGTPSTEEDLGPQNSAAPPGAPSHTFFASTLGNDDWQQRIFPVLGFVYGLEGIRICASIDVDNSFVTAKLAGVYSIARAAIPKTHAAGSPHPRM
jgi:hypothetical protein